MTDTPPESPVVEVATIEVATVRVPPFIPWPILVTLAALAVAMVLAMTGLITYSFQASDDAARARAVSAALTNQVADLRTQATCVQVVSNQVADARGVQSLAASRTIATIASFIVSALNHDPTPTAAIKAQLTTEAAAINKAAATVADALARQRAALATC